MDETGTLFSWTTSQLVCCVYPDTDVNMRDDADRALLNRGYSARAVQVLRALALGGLWWITFSPAGNTAPTSYQWHSQIDDFFDETYEKTASESARGVAPVGSCCLLARAAWAKTRNPLENSLDFE